MAICEFGLYIKRELLNKQMTQRELSEKADINEKVMSDIIHGRNIKQAHKDRICEILGSNT